MNIDRLPLFPKLKVEPDLIPDPKRDTRLLVIPDDQSILPGRKSEKMVLTVTVRDGLEPFIGPFLLSRNADVLHHGPGGVMNGAKKFRSTGLCPEQECPKHHHVMYTL